MSAPSKGALRIYLQAALNYIRAVPGRGGGASTCVNCVLSDRYGLERGVHFRVEGGGIFSRAALTGHFDERKDSIACLEASIAALA